MELNLSEFLEDGYFNGEQAKQTREAVRNLLGEIRPDAVSIVDAFNIPDFILDSPLGRYDGNVYEHWFEQIKSAPNSQAIPSYFEKHIKPLTDPDYKPEE